METKFNIGDRVATKPENPYDATQDYYKRVGKVVGMTTKVANSFGVVMGAGKETNGSNIQYTVEWDQDRWGQQQTDARNEDGLIAENECDALVKSLTDAYNDVAGQIASKMEEAGKLIAEAEGFAKRTGAKRLSYLYEEIYPLMDAMEKAGWSTSSLSC